MAAAVIFGLLPHIQKWLDKYVIQAQHISLFSHLQLLGSFKHDGHMTVPHPTQVLFNLLQPQYSHSPIVNNLTRVFLYMFLFQDVIFTIVAFVKLPLQQLITEQANDLKQKKFTNIEAIELTDAY